MTHLRNQALYPLIFAAAVSIATFSGIGVAAITGHLAVSNGGFELFVPMTSRQAQGGEIRQTSIEEPSHAGITRPAGSDPVPLTKPFKYRPGQRINQTQQACTACGVVQSIEPRTQQSATDGTPAGGVLAGDRDGLTAAMVSGEYGGAYSRPDSRDLVSYVVRVKMQDGSYRTIYENQRPAFSIGERVKLINGSVESVG